MPPSDGEAEACPAAGPGAAEEDHALDFAPESLPPPLHDQVSSGSDGTEAAIDLDIGPPKYERSQRRFADPVEEDDFCNKDLAPKFAYRIRWYALLFAGFTLVFVLGEFVCAGWQMNGSAALNALVSCGYAMLGGLGHYGQSRPMRVRVYEAACILLLTCHSSVVALMFSPDRLALFGLTPPSCDIWLARNHSQVTFRTALLPVATGIFLPCQPHPYAGYLLVVLLQALLLDHLAPPADSVSRWQDSLTLAFILWSMMFGRNHITAARRNEFHYRRSIAAAVRAAQRSARERRRLEAAEATQRLQLLTANAAKQARGRLIRIVMHDLRSPLLSIANIATTLQELDADVTMRSAEVVPRLEALGTCATLMENIVSDMLDFERIDSGRLVLVPKRFHVNSLVRAAMATFSGLAQAKGVQLTAQRMPPKYAKRCVEGDARRLQQCLNNGVSNAIKFTDPGGKVTITATILDEVHRYGDGWESVRLSVTDTGIGLLPEELEVINRGNLFAQVGRGQLQGNGGTGLGLGITRQLLALHNDSTLRMHSDGPGTGTTFELQLDLKAIPGGTAGTVASSSAWSTSSPIAPDRLALPGGGAQVKDGTPKLQHRLGAVPASKRLSNAARSTGSADSPPSSPHLRPLDSRTPALSREPSQSSVTLSSLDTSDAPAEAGAQVGVGVLKPPPRVLYVDDDKFLQLTMPSRIFERIAVDYDTALDGAQAVDMVLEQKRSYIVILMDNQMPKMCGTAATRALRYGGYQGRIIGMTGDPGGSSDREEFEASGLDICVDKDNAGIDSVMGIIQREIAEYYGEPQLDEGSMYDDENEGSQAAAQGSSAAGELSDPPEPEAQPAPRGAAPPAAGMEHGAPAASAAPPADELPNGNSSPTPKPAASPPPSKPPVGGPAAAATAAVAGPGLETESAAPAPTFLLTSHSMSDADDG